MSSYQEQAFIRDYAKYSHARRIKPLQEIHNLKDDRPRCPKPLRSGVTMRDGKKYTFFSDGSLRHRSGPRVRRTRRVRNFLKFVKRNPNTNRRAPWA